MAKKIEELMRKNGEIWGEKFVGYSINGKSGYIVQKHNDCKLGGVVRSYLDRMSIQLYTNTYGTRDLTLRNDSPHHGFFTTPYQHKEMEFFWNKKDAYDYALKNIMKVRKNLNKRVMDLSKLMIEED